MLLKYVMSGTSLYGKSTAGSGSEGERRTNYLLVVRDIQNSQVHRGTRLLIL
jgi:hypothetical protein